MAGGFGVGSVDIGEPFRGDTLDLAQYRRLSRREQRAHSAGARQNAGETEQEASSVHFVLHYLHPDAETGSGLDSTR